MTDIITKVAEGSYVIVGVKECYYCDAARGLLNVNGFEYTFFDTSGQNWWDVVESLKGIAPLSVGKPNSRRTCPICFHDGRYLGGYSALEDYVCWSMYHPK